MRRSSSSMAPRMRCSTKVSKVTPRDASKRRDASIRPRAPADHRSSNALCKPVRMTIRRTIRSITDEYFWISSSASLPADAEEYVASALCIAVPGSDPRHLGVSGLGVPEQAVPHQLQPAVDGLRLGRLVGRQLL